MKLSPRLFQYRPFTPEEQASGSMRGFTLLQKACGVWYFFQPYFFIGCGCGQECLRSGQAIQQRLKRNLNQPTMAPMSNAYLQLLDAAIQHLEEMKANGTRVISVSSEAVAAVRRCSARDPKE